MLKLINLGTGIFLLGLFGLVAGVILTLHGDEVPDAVWTVALTALGALAGAFVRTTKENDAN